MRQLCLTLCDHIDGSPPGSPIPGILQARTLAWVAISFSNEWKWKVKVKSFSRVRLFTTPWTAAYQVLHPWDSPGKSTGVGCHCLLWYKHEYIWIYMYAYLVYNWKVFHQYVDRKWTHFSSHSVGTWIHIIFWVNLLYSLYSRDFIFSFDFFSYNNDLQQFVMNYKYCNFHFSFIEVYYGLFT